VAGLWEWTGQEKHLFGEEESEVFVTASGIELRWQHGLWLGVVPFRHRILEAVLGGTPEAPDEAHLAALNRFLDRLEDNIAALKKRVRFGILYHPIRIAINNQARVGIQFRHRLTGNQSILIQE
jgi:hypothetical protein